MRGTLYYALLAISVFNLVGLTEGIGQRKKDSEKTISSSKLREAEFYFIEGEKYYILEDYAKALALFKKSEEIDPDNATVYYKIGQILLKNKDIDGALKHALKALELNKNNKYFYLLVIEVYSEKGDFDNVTNTYEHLIDNVPNTFNYLFELAAIYLYQQKYTDALTTYDRLEENYGFSENTAFQKHRIYHQIGQQQDALQELRRLVNHFPYEEDYVISLAEYLIALDREKEAIAFLDSAINKNPTNSRASLLAGEAMRKNGNLPRAQEMLSIAFEDENINVDAKVRLVAQYRNYLPDENLEGLIVRLCDILIRVHSSEANVYAVYGDLLNEMNKKGPARDQYYQSVRLDDSNFAVWQNILLIETQLSEFDSVIVHSEQAMEIFPNQGIVYYLNGYAYLRKAKHQEAITSLEYGKRISTSNLKIINDFNSLLGEAYNGVKDYEKSDSAYDASLDYDPNNYIVLNNYSYYLALRNENMDKAEKMSARLVKENPQDATFLDTYAWVLYTRAKFKEAKKIIERALDSGKAKAIHFEHYGDILYKLGDIDGAVEQWQNAKGMDSTLRLIDKKIADKKLYEN